MDNSCVLWMILLIFFYWDLRDSLNFAKSGEI